MSLISFSNVTKYYSNDLILDHISFNINKNEKVALIGDNGTGKTTILKMILNEEDMTPIYNEEIKGNISILKNTRIGYLNQNCIEDVNNTVYQELLLVFKDQIELNFNIDKMLELIKSNPNDLELLNQYEILTNKFKENGGYDFENKIDFYLSKFNFPLSIKERKISLLSGGEKMKIAFIKILLLNYDLLLLDEPTNHIDLLTIEWLENFLTNYQGTILFISHDRYFISKLATKILELENHKINTYNSNYDTYLKLKHDKYEFLLKESIKEQKLIEKYQKFIEYFMPKPRFASRAKDRVKKLEKLNSNLTIVPNTSNNKININLKGEIYENKQVLEFKDVEVGYNFSLIKPFSITLYGQDRLAIVGENGIGKTTLIKTILNKIPIFKGSINTLRKISIGYIDQENRFDNENLDALTILKNNFPEEKESYLRGILGKFLFKDDEIYKKVCLMSNGEKTRLSLSIISNKVNDLLILDEPTNHLDMISKECLIEALKKYKGCIIFISHDRYFINELSNNILYLAKDFSYINSGNLDDNLEKIESLKNNFNSKDDKIETKKDFNKPLKDNKLSNNKIIQLQKELFEIENKIKEIDDLLNKNNLEYFKYDELNKEKEILESKYFEIMLVLENNI